MNRRELAIERWLRENRPDLLRYLPPWFENEALSLISGISFEAGRQFQHETSAELNNPNIYLEVSKKADMVLHHNDPPCTARLENGFCPECKFVPDMQNTCFYEADEMSQL